MSRTSELGAVDRQTALREAIPTISLLVKHGIQPRLTGGMRLGYYRVRFVHLLTRSDLDYMFDILSRHFDTTRYNWRSGKCLHVRRALPVFIHTALRDSYGAMSIYLTGPKLFTRMIVNIAEDQGYIFDTRGIWHKKARIGGVTERQVFNCLGLRYFHPAERREIGKKIRERQREAKSVRHDA